MSDSLKIWGTEYPNAKGFKAKDPTGQTTFTYLRPQGTKAITQNGTGIDVAEYATVDVAVPTSASVTYYTGSSTPSSSFGSDGDIYLQTS